jgi:hypothetical protein
LTIPHLGLIKESDTPIGASSLETAGRQESGLFQEFGAVSPDSTRTRFALFFMTSRRQGMDEIPGHAWKASPADPKRHETVAGSVLKKGWQYGEEIGSPNEVVLPVSTRARSARTC